MSKKYVSTFLIGTLLVSLSACRPTVKNESVMEDYPQEETAEKVEIIPFHLEENTFFKELYYEFVKNYQDYDIEAAEALVEEKNYSYSTIDQDGLLKSITVWDKSSENNHLFLSFDSPQAPKKPMLFATDLYLNSEDVELSFANYSADLEPKYEEYTIYIPENSQETLDVDSIEEQIARVNELLTEEKNSDSY